jgi:hypothetical protein
MQAALAHERVAVFAVTVISNNLLIPTMYIFSMAIVKNI